MSFLTTSLDVKFVIEIVSPGISGNKIFFGFSCCKEKLNIARIANAVPVNLYSRITVKVEIVVLNCQNCNQCLKGHKSLGSHFQGVLSMSFLLVRSCLLITLITCLKGHKYLRVLYGCVCQQCAVVS